MSAFGYGGDRITPSRPISNRPISRLRTDGGEWQLKLKTVIGTTTTSANSFDSLPHKNVFACCAGPAVIFSQVDEDLNVSRRIFRARPDALPLNTTPSFYNSSTPPHTPNKSRDGKIPNLGSSHTSEYTLDSPNSFKAKTRSREATSVSISRDGKFLAVGETAHPPRVTIWSTAPASSLDVPLSILTDHNFGVQSVAFSRDSRWLCSLGGAFDAFLLLYLVNAKTGSAKLHASNKCSNVQTIAWIGDTLITVGIRHVKLWRTESVSLSPTKGRIGSENSVPGSPRTPGPKTFSGRNCLLGSLIDATFTCIVPLCDSTAFLCTTSGDVCLLNDRDKTQRLDRIAQLQFDIRCAYFDKGAGCVWLGGKEGQIVAMGLEMSRANLPISVTTSYEPGAPSGVFLRQACIVAIGSVRDCIVTVDSERSLNIKKKDGKRTLALDSRCSLAHESAVLGVCSSSYAGCPGFLTYSARGTVLFWDLDGSHRGRLEVSLVQPTDNEENDGVPNEIRKLAAPTFDESLYVADRIGQLHIVDHSGTTVEKFQAHNGEINGISVGRVENKTLIATCGRDRIVQLFSRDDRTFKHLQTLDDHAATVGDVKFLDHASTMVSMSSDRSIIVRRLARSETSLAFIMVRAVVLKASPVSFAAVPFDPTLIVVSTMDRQLQKIDVSTGRILHTFKATDTETGGDSVLMSSLEVHELDRTSPVARVLLGVSPTDKSIRIHLEDGTLLTREHGQTAMSAVTLIQQRETDCKRPRVSLISCGYDGTISVWGLEVRRSHSHCEPTAFDRHESPANPAHQLARPPRKVLSKHDISLLQESLEPEVALASMQRSSSPSRIRWKTSRYSLASTSHKSSSPVSNHKISQSVLHSRDACSPLQDQPFTPDGPVVFKTHKISPSLDHRRRSKSVANLNDLAVSICENLQSLRKRMSSTVADKLSPEIRLDFEHEVKLTFYAMNGLTTRNDHSISHMPEDVLRTHVAKIIDERLALKTRSNDLT